MAPPQPPALEINQVSSALTREQSSDPEKLSRTSTHESSAALPVDTVNRGAERIDALYRVFGKKGGKIWALYLSIAAISYAGKYTFLRTRMLLT